MGWLYYAKTRQSLIDDLVKREESEHFIRETVKHCIRGNVLWAVVRRTAKVDTETLRKGESYNFIGCTLLSCHSGKWGYKDMVEAMHPCYYSCPLSYLELAPETSPEWRSAVVAHHRRRKAERRRKSHAGSSGLFACLTVG